MRSPEAKEAATRSPDGSSTVESGDGDGSVCWSSSCSESLSGCVCGVGDSTCRRSVLRSEGRARSRSARLVLHGSRVRALLVSCDAQVLQRPSAARAPSRGRSGAGRSRTCRRRTAFLRSVGRSRATGSQNRAPAPRSATASRPVALDRSPRSGSLSAAPSKSTTSGRAEPALANDGWLTAGSAEDAWTDTDAVTKALPIASSTRARTTFGVRIVLAANSARCPGAFTEAVTIARLCRRTASAR